MTTRERLDTVRLWHQDLTSDVPSWDDVEIIVRLRITDEGVARQILLEDAETLLGHWTTLQRVLAQANWSEADTPATPVATSTPATSTAPDTPPGPPAAATGQARPTGRDVALTGVAAQRLEVLTAWREEARGAGRDVDEISDEDLILIAKLDPKDVRQFKQFRKSVRNFDNDMMAALEHAQHELPKPDQVHVDAAPAPAAPTPAAPTPEGATPATGATASRRGATTPLDFTNFDYRAAAEAAPATPEAIDFHATGEESLELSWPAPPQDGHVRIFSVVASNEYAPVASPALGDLIVSTFDTEAVDTREFTSPVRYVAIWMSRGAREQEARTSQPTLYAAGACVLPVRDCVVREDEGTVIGSWEAIPGVARVDVLRVPADQAERAAYYNESFRIPPSVVTSGGFTDDGAVPGASYEYRIYALAEISGSEELSPHVARQVTLKATVEPVIDLEVTPTEGSESTFDLTWTPPALGDVEIYRSEKAPASGIDAMPLDRTALTGQGLKPEFRLDRMRERESGRVAMRNVPWPKGWSRAYFTPVTVLNDGLMQVGKSRNLTRAKEVTHLRLIERVDEQFLTFMWPSGAPMVKIYCGPLGSERLDPATEPPIQELTEDEYNKYGGAHLNDPLPSEGCSVHLVGTSFTGGQARYAKPATVQYEGLARIKYRVEAVEDARRGRSARPSSILRVLAKSATSPTNLRFVAVHNQRRLPLHPSDGTVVQQTVASFVADHPQTLFETLDTAGLTGYLRIFAALPPEHAHRVAVLDPPLDQLQLG
jgi:hypothetical protein